MNQGIAYSRSLARTGAVTGASMLVRNASALMLSTVVGGALGFLFWVVAARYFPASSVGRASALVSSMTLLAGIAQLNLSSLYARFLPTAGSRSLRMILGGAGASAAMSVVGTACFLWWGLASDVVTRGAWVILLFTVGVIASALYFIVDGTLTALGRAGWVPAKHVLASGAKLLLLVVLSAIGAAAAGLEMVVAWVIPVVVAVAILGFILVHRVVPAHASATLDQRPPPPRREMLRFVSAEYVNGVVANSIAFVPPVLVALVLGPTQSAYFYIPWLIGVSGITLLWNVVTTFVTAASTHGGDHGATARGHLRRAMWLGQLVTWPLAIVLITAAEPLMLILGPAYAEHSTLTLRLVGASLPFTAVILFYAAFAMMQKRMWGLTAVQSVGFAILMALSWLGLHNVGGRNLGPAAPALAHLIGQAVVAAAILPAVIRRYRSFGYG